MKAAVPELQFPAAESDLRSWSMFKALL